MTDTFAEVSELARLLTSSAKGPVTISQGMIAGFGPGSLQVFFQGQAPGDVVALPIGGIRFLKSYVPKIGDAVHVLGLEGDRIIIGKVNPAYDVVPDVYEIGIADAPAYQNSWHAFGGVYGPPRYWIDVDGWVHFAGHIAGGTASGVMWTMPEGLRPNSLKRFVISRSVTTSASSWALLVNPNGNVSLENKSLPAGINLNVGLNDIRYMAEDGLADWERNHEWTPFIYTDEWTWDTSHDGYDYPAIWQRWDGLVRARGHMAGFGGNTIGYLPERASLRRYSSLFHTIEDTGTVLQNFRVDIEHFRRTMFAKTQPGANDITFDGMQWLSDVPESALSPLQLSGSWVAYAVDGQWGNPAYYMDGYGVVHVQGLIKSGSVVNGTSVAWLPPGFRPLYKEGFIGLQGQGTSMQSCRLEVDPSDGFIRLITSGTFNNHLTLDHISFVANPNPE